MTDNKRFKRAVREFAAGARISYAAAYRRLKSDPALAAAYLSDDGGDGWDELTEYFDELLRQHTVFCVGVAWQDAIDLGTDLDYQARQVAAQLLEESPLQCRCGGANHPDLSPWTSYRVLVELDVPLLLDDQDGITEFAERLFDALGIFAGSVTPWEPSQVDGTGVSYLTTRSIAVNVTDPIAAQTSESQDERLDEAGAEDVVRDALEQLDLDLTAARLNASRIVLRDLEHPVL